MDQKVKVKQKMDKQGVTSLSADPFKSLIAIQSTLAYISIPSTIISLFDFFPQ